MKITWPTATVVVCGLMLLAAPARASAAMVGAAGGMPSPMRMAAAGRQPFRMTREAGIVKVSGTLTSNTTWARKGAREYLIVGLLDVPAGVTLTIDPGAVVKGEAGSGACGENPAGTSPQCTLSVEGTLNATGATFTSYNAQPGDWQGIAATDNGTVDLTGSTIEDAPNAVSIWSDAAQVTVSNCQFTDTNTGVTTLSGASTAAMSVTGSKFRNVETAASLNGAGPAPTLSGNTATAVGGIAYNVSSQALNLAQLTGNTATGLKKATPAPVLAMQVSGTLGTSSTWPADPKPDVPLLIRVLLDVPAGVTLTIDPGAVVKGEAGSGACGENPAGTSPQCTLSVEGTLNATGATFTSYNDNSVGDTTGDGQPQTGDWAGIGAWDGSSVSLAGTSVKFASIGVLDTTGMEYSADFGRDIFADNGTAVDVVAGQNTSASVNHNKFNLNGTAVQLDASGTLNATIEDNQFVDNGTAIDASSDWTWITGPECVYVPTMDARGNTFGPQHSTTPLVTQNAWDAIQIARADGAESWPPDWYKHISVGSTDVVVPTIPVCVNLTDPEDPLGLEIAIPLFLGR
jgi:hypothetical protein